MARNTGFIKLPRDILHMPIIKEARDFTLWVYCAMRVGFRPYKDCEPGQFISSRLTIASQLGWGRNTLKRHLENLSLQGYLDVEDTGYGVKITLRNWPMFSDEAVSQSDLKQTQTDLKQTSQVFQNGRESGLNRTVIAPKRTKNCSTMDHVQEDIQEEEPFVQGVRRREFEIFWDAYPRKDWKQRAVQAFDALQDVSLATLMLCLEQAKWTKQWLEDEGRFIPTADKWLTELWKNYLPKKQNANDGEELWMTY